MRKGEAVEDRGLWISWYDLPESGRDAYLAWLHGKFIPGMLKKPGVLWAAHYAAQAQPIPAGGSHRLRHTDDPSVPTGNGHILIFGGATAHAFANLTLRKLEKALAPEDRRMLALRVGERVNIVNEEARAAGPAAKRREGRFTLAPCIQLGSFNAGSADEDEILDWYASWRIPSMRKLPGCLGIRKLNSVSGWAKHAVLYEFESLAARDRYFPSHEDARPEMAAWTDALVRKLVHAPGSPNVAVRLWPPLKAVARKKR
jgi:hypothetical protein